MRTSNDVEAFWNTHEQHRSFVDTRRVYAESSGQLTSRVSKRSPCYWPSASSLALWLVPSRSLGLQAIIMFEISIAASGPLTLTSTTPC